MITKIFVDLDDVLANCTITALRQMGCTVDLSTYRPEWGWNIHEAANALLGTPDHFDRLGFWAHFDRYFWAHIPVQHGAEELLRTCEALVGADRVCILTTPTPFGGCCDGKIDWVCANFPSYRDRLLIGSPKHLCASPDSLLIDDRQGNISNFVAANSSGILYPRPWNGQHAWTHVAHHKVMQVLHWLQDAANATSTPAQSHS
jgi:5'(3')-deoxyribonucleotidase